MSPPKKDNGWAQLSLAFDESDTTIPRKREKKEPSEREAIFKQPHVVAFKRANKIESLSKLIAACEPKKTTDLSVSKQKQKEISEWFARGAGSCKSRVLVITGPSGCGKTAALKVIAKEHDYEVMEWTTPADSMAYERFASICQSDKFLDFLIRATRYNSVFQANGRRLLLVKDIPNVYLIKPDTFITVLDNYFQYGKEPLVFICTDGGNSRILKTLFPNDVREQFGIDVIGINSSTQAAMKCMLKRVSVILNSRANHIIDVKQHNIDEVLSNSIGDVRSAILNLIFISLKVADNESRRDCGTREESLGLLHGVGRVINPKRIQTGDSWKFVHDPDDIASYFLSQSTTFLHFLHENYMNTMAGVEEIELCADMMSLSDTITYEWRDPNLTKVNLSFCIRGVMVINKKPVSGWNPVRKPRSEEIKISRDLGTAEERWYKSIICPRENRDVSNLDNTIIEQNSD